MKKWICGLLVLVMLLCGCAFAEDGADAPAFPSEYEGCWILMDNSGNMNIDVNTLVMLNIRDSLSIYSDSGANNFDVFIPNSTGENAVTAFSYTGRNPEITLRLAEDGILEAENIPAGNGSPLRFGRFLSFPQEQPAEKEEDFIGSWRLKAIMSSVLTQGSYDLIEPSNVEAYVRILPEASAMNVAGNITLAPSAFEDGVIVDTSTHSPIFGLFSGGLIGINSSDQVILFERSDNVPEFAMYSVSGPDQMVPGETAEFTVTDYSGDGEPIVWSVEGEGASMDPDSGKLTIAEGSTGTFTVTAAKPSKGQTVTASVTVTKSVFTAEDFNIVSYKQGRGFSVPEIKAWKLKKGTEQKDSKYYIIEKSISDDSAPYKLVIGIRFQYFDSFPNAGAVIDHYEYISTSYKNSTELGGTNWTDRTVEIDGHPVLLTICLRDGKNVGNIFYIRENTMLCLNYIWSPKDDTPADVQMNMADLELIARMIQFDEAQAPVRKADGELTVGLKGDPTVLSAGKKVTFAANFANAKAVKAAKLTDVKWSVREQGKEDAPDGVSISEKGQLVVDKNLSETKHLVITVRSEIFETEAQYELTVTPIVKKLTADPAEITLKVGEQVPIQVSTEPEFTPAGLSWTVKSAKVAEVTGGEGGEGVVTGVAPGKTAVTVKEPGGKAVTIKVTVVSD